MIEHRPDPEVERVGQSDKEAEQGGTLFLRTRKNKNHGEDSELDNTAVDLPCIDRSDRRKREARCDDER